MKKILLLGLLLLGIVTIGYAGHVDSGTPLISGRVTVFGDSRAIQKRDLTPGQLQAMSHWIQESRSNWSGDPVEASPNEKPALLIELTHSDARSTSIAVMADTNDGKHLVRLIGPGKWSYESFGGLYKTWSAFRVISDDELRALQSLVGTANQ